MKVTFHEGVVTLERENGDPKFYGKRNAAGESRLLHLLKVTLQRQGHDVIKKRMWRDGHLVDDFQQYVRTRSPKSPRPHIAIFNPMFAIRGAEEEWNERGSVTLDVVWNFFGEADGGER